jgi:hypothetical protein
MGQREQGLSQGEQVLGQEEEGLRIWGAGGKGTRLGAFRYKDFYELILQNAALCGVCAPHPYRR